MTESLKRAFDLASKLSEADQDSLAAAILAEIDADQSWDRAFSSRPDALGRLAEEALDDYRAGKTEPLDPDKI